MGVARDKTSRGVDCLHSVGLIISVLLNAQARDTFLENEATGDGCFFILS
jgi:hypothetical protein